MGEVKENIKTEFLLKTGLKQQLSKSDYKRACTCKYCFQYIFANLCSAIFPFSTKPQVLEHVPCFPDIPVRFGFFRFGDSHTTPPVCKV